MLSGLVVEFNLSITADRDLCKVIRVNVSIIEKVTAFFITAMTALSMYFVKVVVEMPAKYVSKMDCQRTSDQMHKENREDHQEMFGILNNDLRSGLAEIKAFIRK